MQRDLVLIRLPIFILGAAVMMRGSAAAQTPNVRYINPPTMAKAPGYTHVVEVNGAARSISRDNSDMTAPVSKARIFASRRRWSTKT